MALNVEQIQVALRAEGLAGWLLYDFHGSNPIAARLAGTAAAGKMTTRRWFYLIPATGEPRGLVHAIERHNLDGLPGTPAVYAGRQELEQGLAALLQGVDRVAMEYSPGCAIPYISRVDGGTIEMVRRHGVEVVSSGDLVQRFEATWDDRALTSHRVAAAGLYRIKDRTFEAVTRALRDGDPISEIALQRRMVGWFKEEGLESDSPPVVAAQENAGNPHYMPTETSHRSLGAGELLLIDLWGKIRQERAVYADITWVGFTGTQVPGDMARAFEAIRTARDRAASFVREGVQQGRDIRGWEVDRAARATLEEAGYGAYILHRTGHSLGTEVHGNGAHLDDFESHDERRILPGSGFTIEPGLYFDRFGVRTEVNMFVGGRDAALTGPAQTEILSLASL